MSRLEGNVQELEDVSLNAFDLEGDLEEARFVTRDEVLIEGEGWIDGKKLFLIPYSIKVEDNRLAWNANYEFMIVDEGKRVEDYDSVNDLIVDNPVIKADKLSCERRDIVINSFKDVVNKLEKLVRS